MRNLIHSLLVRIGRHHPQALMYPLLVAAKSQSPSRRQAAYNVLDVVRTHSATLVEQAQVRLAQQLNSSCVCCMLRCVILNGCVQRMSTGQEACLPSQAHCVLSVEALCLLCMPPGWSHSTACFKLHLDWLSICTCLCSMHKWQEDSTGAWHMACHTEL